MGRRRREGARRAQDQGLPVPRPADHDADADEGQDVPVEAGGDARVEGDQHRGPRAVRRAPGDRGRPCHHHASPPPPPPVK